MGEAILQIPDHCCSFPPLARSRSASSRISLNLATAVSRSTSDVEEDGRGWVDMCSGCGRCICELGTSLGTITGGCDDETIEGLLGGMDAPDSAAKEDSACEPPAQGSTLFHPVLVRGGEEVGTDACSVQDPNAQLAGYDKELVVVI